MRTLILLIFSLVSTVVHADLQLLKVEALRKKDKSVQIVFTPPSYWKPADVKIMNIAEASTYFRELQIMKNGGSIIMKSNGVSHDELLPVLKSISENSLSLHFSTLDGKDIRLLAKKLEQDNVKNPLPSQNRNPKAQQDLNQ